MLTTRAIDVNVEIEHGCPYCGFIEKTTLGREPELFDTACSECEEFYTVKC